MGTGNSEFIKQNILEENAKINKAIITEIGEENFIHMENLLSQIDGGLRLIFLPEFVNVSTNVEDKLDILRKAGNNIYGHATAQNGRPERIIKALLKLIDETNFS